MHSLSLGLVMKNIISVFQKLTGKNGTFSTFLELHPLNNLLQGTGTAQSQAGGKLFSKAM